MTKDRNAVITGAGSGIGRATAIALSHAGWNVALAGRRDDALSETAQLCTGDALALATDVTQPDDVAQLFNAAAERFGRITLLFNNAGTGAAPVPFGELTDDDWQHVVNVNLTGSFLCAREAWRHMVRQDPSGGRIINNGSVSATTPRPNSAPYTATKHAITGLTKSLSLDGRAHGILCGQIDIGNALTPMAQQMTIGMPQADGSVRAEATMDVEHAANAVVHMANLPPEANVLFMTVMANEMPFVGRG